jgi:hypothetical protein
LLTISKPLRSGMVFGNPRREEAPMTESSPEEKPMPTIRRVSDERTRERAKLRPPHRRIEEEELDDAGEKRYVVRRWVVERTPGWFSKCRAVSVRYEKKSTNSLEG